MTESIQTVAVIGAGTMGAGIAQVAASAGYQTVLFDLQADKAKQAKASIEIQLDKRVARKKIEQAQRDSLLGRIECSTRLQDVAKADLVIEAIVENLEVKQGLFRDLEAICRADCILASNTSSISITSIASVLTHPQRFVGLHFFNPAPLMKLVEVVTGIATDDAICAQAKQWSESCGKQAVVTRSLPGFIVNRVARPFYAEALRALEVNVAQVQDIDYCLTQAGQFRMGPFALMDLIGHDVNYAVTKSVYDAYYQDKRFLPSLIQKELVDAGFLGRKSGRGFYHYTDSKIEPSLNFAPACSWSDALAPTMFGDWSFAPTMAQLIDCKIDNQTSQTPYIDISGIDVVPTQGITASQLAAETGRPVVVVDYCQNYLESEVIILAAADQNRQHETEKVVAFFQSTGKQVMLVDDYPGLIVWRTWVMLINEALELANQGGATSTDIDIAMKSGVNYPHGPIEQGQCFGWDLVLSTLSNLQQFYAEERYRPSPLLRRLALTNKGVTA